MREEVIQDLMNIFYAILTSGNINLIKTCLKTLQNYIDWIDINLVTSEKYAKLFYGFLNTNETRSDAIICLDNIVCKGMKHEEKYNLINKLQLIQAVCSINLNVCILILEMGDNFVG